MPILCFVLCIQESISLEIVRTCLTTIILFVISTQIVTSGMIMTLIVGAVLLVVKQSQWLVRVLVGVDF